MQTRRSFVLSSAAAALAGGLRAAKMDSRVNGVLLGVQSYSLRDRPLDACIAAITEVGLSECELWQGHVEPKTSGSDRRQDLRKWRSSVSLDEFRRIREQFDKAGISLSAYNYSFRDDF